MNYKFTIFYCKTKEKESVGYIYLALKVKTLHFK